MSPSRVRPFSRTSTFPVMGPGAGRPPFVRVIVPGTPAHAQGVPPGSDADDDEMLILARDVNAARPSRREPRTPSPAPLLTTANRLASPSPTHPPPAPPVCEHDRRNGL